MPEPAPVEAPQEYRWGGFASWDINIHGADFKELPGVDNCCQKFTGGSGSGYSLGGLFELPLDAHDYLLGIRADYTRHDATLRSIENTTVGLNSQPAQASIEHLMETQLSSIGLQALAGFRLFDRFYLHVGPRIGLWTGKSYSYRETLVEPSDIGAFNEQGDRVRNERSGDVDDAAMVNPSVLAGLSYEIPLNRSRTTVAAVEAFYNHSLANVVDGVDWQAHAVRLGVALKRSIGQSTMPMPPAPPPAPTLAADVRAVGLDANGVETPGKGARRVDETMTSEVFPMLNYLFFDGNSSAIPSRYGSGGVGGDPRLAPYYDLLTTVAKRMQENPGTTVTLMGYGDDVSTGSGGLGQSRAEAVRDALVTRGVSPARIRVGSGMLPPVPSNTSDPDGIAENQRVEIIAPWSIIQPITSKSVARATSESGVRFRPTTTGAATVASWELKATQAGRVVKSASGTGPVPATVDMTRDEANALDWSQPLFYTLEVRDPSGRVTTTPERSLTLEQTTNRTGFTIDRASLILFGFDESRLDPNNQSILNTIVRPRMKGNSSTTVTGYTDRIGEAEYNQRLSEARANEVARALGGNIREVRGEGERSLLYNNDLPEGRFYSRTVNITVETPFGE